MTPVGVLHVISDREFGGAGRYVEMTVLGLRQTGLDAEMELAVACPGGGQLERVMGDLGLEPDSLPEADRSLSMANMSAVRRILTRRAREGRPVTVVHTHASAAACMAARGRVRGIIMTRHGPGRTPSGRPDSFPSRMLRHLATRALAHRVVAVSEGVRSELLRQGVPDSMIAVIPNGIDVDRWAIPREPGPPTVAITARLSPEKGHGVFLESVRTVLDRAPGTRFWIVGQGPLREELEARARALGVSASVEFPGFRSDLESLYRHVTVGVSASWHEGFNLSLAEFMAAGIPVVATRVDGQAELIEHGRQGLLVPPGDAGALGSAIASLIGEPALAARMGRAGRERVRDSFSAAVMARRLADCYRSLAGVGGP